jgi:hypothetical protein
MVYKYNYFSIDHSKIRVTTMMFELKLLIRRTFIGASKPFRAPSTSLMPIAIQYVVLIPNNVLNMTLQNADASRIAKIEYCTCIEILKSYTWFQFP